MVNTIKPDINGIIISGKVYDVLAEKTERSCEGCSLYGLGSCGMSYHCTHLKCIFQFNKELTNKLTNCNKLYADYKMIQTKDQQAQEYAEENVRYVQKEIDDNGSSYNAIVDALTEAYSDGYAACERSMWRSVEKELPEDSRNIPVLVKTRKGSISGPYTICFFSDGKFHNSRSVDIPVIAWMYIPSLPETNTEKK